MGAKKLENHECKVITIDFQSRVKVSTSTIVTKPKKSKYDMSGFNPPQGNFANEFWTDKELTENSNHILSYLHELTLDDVFHFVNMGTLDKKKLAKKLKLSQE